MGLRRYGPGPIAQTMAFATLVSAQLLHAPLARVGDRSALLHRGPPNKWLLAGAGLSAALQAAAIFLPPVASRAGRRGAGLVDLLLAGGGAVAAIAGIEGERLARDLLTGGADKHGSMEPYRGMELMS